MDGDGDGCCMDWLGMGTMLNYCGDRGEDGDESCGDSCGGVQISVPVQLSTP